MDPLLLILLKTALKNKNTTVASVAEAANRLEKKIVRLKVLTTTLEKHS